MAVDRSQAAEAVETMALGNHLRAGLGREFGPALESAPTKYTAPAAAAHSFHKTVLPRAAAFLGLISSFGHLRLLVYF